MIEIHKVKGEIVIEEGQAETFKEVCKDWNVEYLYSQKQQEGKVIVHFAVEAIDDLIYLGVHFEQKRGSNRKHLRKS